MIDVAQYRETGGSRSFEGPENNRRIAHIDDMLYGHYLAC